MSLLSFIFSKKDLISTSDLISALASRRQLEELITIVQDPRNVVDDFAKVINQEVDNVLCRLSRKLGVAVAGEIKFPQHYHIYRKLNLERLKALGCFPVCNDREFEYLACVDPGLAVDYLSIKDPSKLRISSWQRISAAWKRVDAELSSLDKLDDENRKQKKISIARKKRLTHDNLHDVFFSFLDHLCSEFARQDLIETQVVFYKNNPRMLRVSRSLQVSAYALDTGTSELLYKYLNINTQSADQKLEFYVSVKQDRYKLSFSGFSRLLSISPIAEKPLNFLDLSKPLSSVLIIEDSPIFVEFFRTAIRKYTGISDGMVAYSNPCKAWEDLLLKKINPELIVCDYDLPGMNGLELIGRIKENSSINYIPCVLLTSSRSRQLQLKAYQAGVMDFIVKNDPAELLAAKVQAWVNCMKVREAINV